MSIRISCRIIAGMAALFAVPIAAFAADDIPQRVTFYEDVLPILQENCQDCHRPVGDNLFGMIAPMSLITHEETRPWAKAISRQVQNRTMPPWHATGEFSGVFKNERTLMDSEIATLVRWVETGASRGNESDGPAARVFDDSGSWTIGEPDLVLEFPESFFIEDSVQDLYQNITVKIPEDKMPENRWIKAMEFRPGSEAVHHIVLFGGRMGDASSGAFGEGMIGGVGPGTDATVFPEGYGRLLKAGSSLIFQMHYHKESGPGTGLWDRSAMAFTFQDKPVTHAVTWDFVTSNFFEIPPRHENWKVGASRVFDRDTTLLALFPHMHLRGKAAKYVAFYPDGSEEILLDVPKFDFNWQTNYVYKSPKEIPAGTRIEVSMWFENGPERADIAGIDPGRSVRWGQPTTDEMMNGFIDFTDTAPVDLSARTGTD